MSKFENVSLEIGDQTFELRCTGSALARIEDIYGGEPFSKAVAAMVGEFEDDTNLKIAKVGAIANALIVGKRPGAEFILDNIGSTADTVRVAGAITSAIIAHFPTGNKEGTGDAGDDVDPTTAGKASKD